MYYKIKEGQNSVVLIHGQPGDSSHWEGVIKNFDDTIRAISLDRCGYARSEEPAGDFYFNAVKIKELLDQLNISKALIVGHSWGGGVAISFAWHFPERTQGLVLISSIGTKDSISLIDYFLAVPALGWALMFSSLFVLDKTFYLFRKTAKKMLNLVPRAQIAQLDKINKFKGHIVPPPFLRSVNSCFAEEKIMVAKSAELESFLESIDVDTLIIAGTKDRLINPKSYLKLHEQIKGSLLVWIEGGNHFLIFEYPEVLANHIVDFMKSLKIISC